MAHVPDALPDDEPALRRPPPPRTWRERVEHLADVTGSTPGRLVAGAAAGVLALAVGLWLTRPPSAPPEVALPFASTTASLPSAITPSAPAVLVVHVAGAVMAPGVHELAPGSRVLDAIEAAGGLLPDADGSRINLAAPVSDGERVYLPRVGEPAPPPVPGASTGPGGDTSGGPVDLNRADQAALEALPGIGPATAAAILRHREQIGAFTSVDQLLDVRGIGEAKLEELRPHVTV